MEKLDILNNKNLDYLIILTLYSCPHAHWKIYICPNLEKYYGKKMVSKGCGKKAKHAWWMA